MHPPWAGTGFFPFGNSHFFTSPSSELLQAIPQIGALPHPVCRISLFFVFCCIWVLNGAMAPFISETFNLSPAQKGLMLSVPIIAGALMRFPLGMLSQYIGRKNATLVEMGLIAVAMLFGFFFVKSYNDLLAMGVLLGIAGASFGVALSLGSGSFPPQAQGPGDGHGRRRQRRAPRCRC